MHIDVVSLAEHEQIRIVLGLSRSLATLQNYVGAWTLPFRLAGLSGTGLNMHANPPPELQQMPSSRLGSFTPVPCLKGTFTQKQLHFAPNNSGNLQWTVAWALSGNG